MSFEKLSKHTLRDIKKALAEKQARAATPVKTLARRKKNAYVRDDEWRVEMEEELGWRDQRQRSHVRGGPRAAPAVTRLQGTVTAVFSDRARVRCDDTEQTYPYMAAWRQQAIGETRPVAVGDEVLLERGRLCEVLPRRNVLRRPSAGGQQKLQAMVANVDQIAIVAATADPPLRRGLIDRYLVAASAAGIDALIVATKMDLAPEDALAALQAYHAIGVAVFPVCVPTHAGLAAVRAGLREKRTVLVGHSGVGKTTLLNALLPGLAARTGDISQATGRGCHTTTGATLLSLPAGGGEVIDTAGIRELGLDVPRCELWRHFIDMVAHAANCRPRCLHQDEPACAVRAAANAGELDAERYRSYLRILASLP